MKILNIIPETINGNYMGALYDDAEWFRDWFVAVAKFAEENWNRPESIFQHIAQVLNDHINSTDK